MYNNVRHRHTGERFAPIQLLRPNREVLLYLNARNKQYTLQQFLRMWQKIRSDKSHPRAGEKVRLVNRTKSGFDKASELPPIGTRIFTVKRLRYDPRRLDKYPMVQLENDSKWIRMDFVVKDWREKSAKK